jgi:hypothetical protein
LVGSDILREGVPSEVSVQQRRHKNDTKTFEELSFEEQTKAMNMTALHFRKQLAAHLRRANEEGRSGQDVLQKRLKLLENILDEHREHAHPNLQVPFSPVLESGKD